MTSYLQVALCCAFLLVATVSARPQVWNIGFHPSGANGNGQVGVTSPSSAPPATTTAPAVQTTTPSRAYYDCLGRCPSTSEYNPICGSDQVNYHNMGKLECAARCGRSVSAVRGGTCSAL